MNKELAAQAAEDEYSLRAYAIALRYRIPVQAAARATREEAPDSGRTMIWNAVDAFGNGGCE